jgi:Histidine kinase-, DNA gyrase B-, and HSP90-like ATPase/His Kinase A (phospho-acceptor) domain
MTATMSARDPLSYAVSDAPGRSQPQEAGEWQLVSEASHELRTPLTALRTEVELALLGNRDASELRAALRSAADEIRRVCRLADDILTLARADHGRLPLRLRPLSPRVLLNAAASRSRAAAWTRGRQIVVNDLAPGSWLLGDPDRAAQALDNLVSNALQYGSGTITLTASEDGKLVGLHVTDQGSGFAEDMVARAFQRFSRGGRVRDPGSGLGLSLVAAIAGAHRGVASVSNLPEGGADACLALPQWFPGTLRAHRARWPVAAVETTSPRTLGCRGSCGRRARPARRSVARGTRPHSAVPPVEAETLPQSRLVEAGHLQWESSTRSQEMIAGGEPSGPQLHAAIQRMTARRMRACEPPETEQMLCRLAALGYDARSIMHIVAAIVSDDICPTIDRQWPRFMRRPVADNCGGYACGGAKAERIPRSGKVGQRADDR